MKRLLQVILLAAVLTAVCAAETKPGFSVQVVPTRAVNLDDQFDGILPNRPPHCPKVSRVACGEPFEVKIIFIGAKVRDGGIRLAGKLVMTGPKGKKQEVPLSGKIDKVSGDVAGVFLFPQSLRIMYEPQDPKGKNTFDVELTDEHSGRTAAASASVEYGDPAQPKPDEKAFERLVKYYREPAPEYIVPAFREFLAGLPKQKAREKAWFNPLPQLAFFYFLLKENPQCIPAFAELFKQLHNEEKYFAAVVLNFASEETAKVLTPNQRQAIGQQFKADPFLVEKASAPWQLDVCWAEFFVRGTRAPVMKIVQALSFANDAVTIDAYKKIAKPTKEDQRKLMNFLTARAARWSLSSLAKEHVLIRYYVEAALVRGEVKDPVAGTLAAKAVGMQVRTETKPKP